MFTKKVPNIMVKAGFVYFKILAYSGVFRSLPKTVGGIEQAELFEQVFLK